MRASSRYSARRIAFGILGLFVLSASTASAGLIHDYEFNGNLNDSLGGPALVSLQDGSNNTGTVGPSSYVFGAQQGLSLSNALTTASASTYTIDLSFEFDTLSGYRKILDFKNLASDNGLYNLDGLLNYFNFATGPTTPFTAGTYARVDLTRDDTTGLVVGYVNGVPQFSFTDSGADATFSTAGNVINFFEDDTVTSGRESSSGSVDQIRIYDTALSASDVAGLGDPKVMSVPEPSGVILTSMGLALAGLGARRFGRRR